MVTAATEVENGSFLQLNLRTGCDINTNFLLTYILDARNRFTRIYVWLLVYRILSYRFFWKVDENLCSVWLLKFWSEFLYLTRVMFAQLNFFGGKWRFVCWDVCTRLWSVYLLGMKGLSKYGIGWARGTSSLLSRLISSSSAICNEMSSTWIMISCTEVCTCYDWLIILISTTALSVRKYQLS